MNAVQEDGCTLREHMESLARQRAKSGKPPPSGLEMLDGPDCPECAEYVWRWFCEISRRRSSGGFAANPISYVEVEAWARLTRTDLAALEVEWIMDLDDSRAIVLAETPSPKRVQQQGKGK